MSISRLALPLLCLAGLSACVTVGTPVVPDAPEVASCKAAVTAQGGSTTTLVSTEPVIDGQMVKLREDSTGTTWDCIIDSNGAIESVDLSA
ncbi:hypothetical protein [Aliiruegeria sabulilitoris]|uniref:hypothetical protein n=1 Tax=Aliiruegeria sabulilitoris TaxID=1510458 RepID=UPI00082CFDFB|nr:hypothetical protein [Aliiruegeria sabulilitoris]NDR59536.1 hypothetical protein [Pseudoruegeria sp. M32A2M]